MYNENLTKYVNTKSAQCQTNLLNKHSAAAKD